MVQISTRLALSALLWRAIPRGVRLRLEQLGGRRDVSVHTTPDAAKSQLALLQIILDEAVLGLTPPKQHTDKTRARSINQTTLSSLSAVINSTSSQFEGAYFDSVCAEHKPSSGSEHRTHFHIRVLHHKSTATLIKRGDRGFHDVRERHARPICCCNSRMHGARPARAPGLSILCHTPSCRQSAATAR